MIKNTPPPRNGTCPICYANEVAVLYDQVFHNAPSSLMNSYDVAICKMCGFVFADNIPSQADFDAYYNASITYVRPYDSSLIDVWNTNRANIFRQFVPDKNLSVLDVGCGDGNFLASLFSFGYINIFGVEPNMHQRNHIMQKLGVDVYDGTISTLDKVEGKFDIIVLLMILEHVQDLHGAMKNLLSVSKDESVLFVEVPDANRFHLFQNNMAFHEFSMEHINFFSKHSLELLMGLYGFELILFKETEAQSTHSYNCPTLTLGFKKNVESFININEYIENSKQQKEIVKRKIIEIHESEEPIIIWPFGQESRDLLATTPLSQCNIICFIDSDSAKHGMKYEGVPILPPEALKNLSHKVVVANSLFHHQIVQALQNDFPNDIIDLFAE